MPDRRPAGTRPTIYDVADAAGVAISTVSRVLNGSSEVADGTRDRVREAIRALQFQPQRNARALAQQATTAVAVALPSATSMFFVEMLKGVKDVLRQRDIDLLLCNLGSSQPYPTLQRFLNRGAVDALLLVAMPVEGDVADQLVHFQAPVVLLGSQYPGLDAFWWDDREGARLATEFLIGQGHERIGLISAHAWSANATPRLDGYRAALDAAGIAFDPELIAAGETTKHAGYSEEAGAEAMSRLMSRDAPPTAIFAASDVQAYGAWSYVRDRGLIVPRDVSIVGYDDLKLSRFLNLTTVAQHMQQAGQMATERLLERLDGGAQGGAHVQLPLELKERGSTAAPKNR